MSYTENKQKLDIIRDKYGCSGEIIFRTAIQYVVEFGQNTFRDEAWYEDQINAIDDRHDTAEAVGKILFMTRNFEKAILECARELAQIATYDLLVYIQREVFLSSNGIDYRRMETLLKKCIEWIEETHASLGETYDTLDYLGFGDSEIEMLGFKYILNVIYPEEEE